MPKSAPPDIFGLKFKKKGVGAIAAKLLTSFGPVTSGKEGPLHGYRYVPHRSESEVLSEKTTTTAFPV